MLLSSISDLSSKICSILSQTCPSAPFLLLIPSRLNCLFVPLTLGLPDSLAFLRDCQTSFESYERFERCASG